MSEEIQINRIVKIIIFKLQNTENCKSILNSTKMYEMNKVLDIIFLKIFLCILFIRFKNSTIPNVRKIIKKNMKNKFEKNNIINEKNNFIDVKSLIFNYKLI